MGLLIINCTRYFTSAHDGRTQLQAILPRTTSEGIPHSTQIMSSQRRYNEKEIAAIFRQAAEDQELARQALDNRDGLTLEELESIGKDIGITPEFISKAADQLDVKHMRPRGTSLLGLPISVDRTIELPGPVSEEDWDVLISDFHDVYGHIGEEKEVGPLRTWKAGTIEATLGPTKDGHRLRIRAQNDGEVIMLSFGTIFFLISIFFLLILLAKGRFGEMDEIITFLAISSLGLSGIGAGVFRLPQWQKKQAQKIETIFTRALNRAGLPESESPQKEQASSLVDVDLSEAPQEVEPTSHGRKNRVR